MGRIWLQYRHAKRLMPSPFSEIYSQLGVLPLTQACVQGAPFIEREHRAQDLEAVFAQVFFTRWNTKLARAGDDEPFYRPAGENNPAHHIFYAHGFFASALHEVAHWCIAGPERRLLEDFGYWYEPDGRTAQQQKAFEQVEIKPQAIEWVLSRACGFKFRISADNLSGETTDAGPFKDNVHQQVMYYCQHGLPLRAEKFREALAAHYGTTDSLDAATYLRQALD